MPVRVAGKAIRDLGYLHTRVNTEELFAGENPKIYTELKRTLDASEQYLNDNDTVIFATATLKRILIIFQSSKKLLPDPFWNDIILHIRRVWDYTAEVACHDAVDTFKLLLSLHLEQCEDCLQRPAGDSHANCDWINEITLWLLEPTTLCRSRFKCISQLVASCPTLRLSLGEDFFRRMYPLLANATFSAVVCELVVDNIFFNEELWVLHCDLLLHLTATHDPLFVKTKLIPKLQKYQSQQPKNGGEKNGKQEEKPEEECTAVRFLNQLLTRLNTQKPACDLQSHLEIVHALVTTTWPKKKQKNTYNLVDFSHWSQCVSEELMSSAIVHVDSEVRLSAFRLLVENPRKTVMFNESDIEYIKEFLDSNMCFQAASARYSMIATYKSMCQRLGASAEHYIKYGSQLDDSVSSPEPIVSSDYDHRDSSLKYRMSRETQKLHPHVDAYVKLVKWMAKLAFESLSPKGNYYRRIMALMQIDVLFTRESFITDNKVLFADELNLESTLASDRHKLVVNCLDDSYEIVQSTALSMLKKLDFGNINLDEEFYLKEAMELMSTARSRNSTAAGYRVQYYLSKRPERYTVFLEKFIDALKNRTEAVARDLMSITTLPLHPILNMMELLLKNPAWQQTNTEEEKTVFYRQKVLDEMFPLCERVIKIVTPVVHNMSPEGCIPDEVSDTLNGHKSTNALAGLSQHLLVCCWRSHRHVSGLFSWIVETLAPKGIVSKGEIESIGTFYWTQLTECKHRGAFESATDGFFQLCKFLWTSPVPSGAVPKPAEWLEDILAACRGEKDLTSLCETRRSAGLPHLVLAIVSTEPKKNENAALMRAADSLLDMTGKTTEYRIHSMNVMKTIVQNAALAERSAFCYERTLRVAIDACRADWSERNAGSQLFAALRTRIFGVSRSAQRSLAVDPKNRNSNYEFFTKFPSLYSFLYHHLKMEQSAFSLLPPLVLLSHLYTPDSSTDTFPLGPFVPPLLKIAMRERNESLRAHAIAAILAISDVYAKEDIFKWVEAFDFSSARQNHIHSVLLLLEGFSGFADYFERVVQVVTQTIRSSVFRRWPDFNINLLLLLANAFCIEYDVDEVDVSKVCLAKRPLAEKLLRDRDVFKTEMCDLLRDADTRKEVYRVICKLGWDSCIMYLRAHVISLAIKDLSSPDTKQCDAKRIMQLLCAGDEFISDVNSKRLEELILSRLADPNLNWTLPSTMAYATKLKYTRCNVPADEDLIRWLRECHELDDPETKKVALDVGGSFVRSINIKRNYSPFEKELIAAVSLYLQDESEYIRQLTSFYLGHLVKDSGHPAINPAICRLLITKFCLNEGSDEDNNGLMRASHEEEEERDDLYEACAVNEYAEHVLFGDIQMYESCLGVTGTNQTEIYDFED